MTRCVDSLKVLHYLAMTPSQTLAQELRTSSDFQAAVDHLLAIVLNKTKTIQKVKSSSSPLNYQQVIQSFQGNRGRELYYPYLSSGIGNGPYVELFDGSIKMDLITGIGVHFFGHSHPALMRSVLEGIASDVMQGNLQPGKEVDDFTTAMLARVGKNSRLKHLWLTCSGTMANEVALKLVRQKKSPATKVLAFRDCFSGRSTAMQEITDNPKYREGQPVYGEVSYLTLYEESIGLAASVQITLSEMKDYFLANPGRYAALMVELVQGEGGFGSAPQDYWREIFKAARAEGLLIWADEIQTFGRTGELFAYQTFGLEEEIDIVTVGKTLQACCVMYTADLNPKPGLIAGTFVGSTASLRAGKRVLELFDEGQIHGPDGKIAQLSKRFLKGFNEIKKKRKIKEIRIFGGMIAFMPNEGSTDDVKKTLLSLFERGYVAFSCGHDPYLVRLLPPLGVMTEAHVDEVLGAIDQTLAEVFK